MHDQPRDPTQSPPSFWNSVVTSQSQMPWHLGLERAPGMGRGCAQGEKHVQNQNHTSRQFIST